MNKNKAPLFYKFASEGYMTTFAAKAIVFRDYIARGEGQKAGDFYQQLIVGDYSGIEFPVIYEQMRDEYGKKRMRDILDMRYPPLYIISDRMKHLLEDNKITGWCSYPILLYDKKGNVISGYNGFSYTGRAKEVADLSEHTHTIRYDYGNSDITYGPSFSDETWDGSDIFMIEGVWAVIVTAKVMKILKDNKITACKFQPLADGIPENYILDPVFAKK